MVRTGDYSLGKVYKIVSSQTAEIYIGSTCQRLLSSRFVQHRTNYKNWLNGKFCNLRSFEILKFDDAQIVLIENFPCQDKYELEARERYHIENNACVNKMIPTRTRKEWRVLHKEEKRITDKEYRQQNKEHIAKSKKDWVERHRDHVRNQLKEWRENNPEYRVEYDKSYYLNHRDEILVKCKEYREAHKDNAREYNKIYRQQNVEKLRELQKTYRENNPDKVKESQRLYNMRNQEKLKEWRNQQVTCEVCNATIKKYDLARHQRSKKCQSHLTPA